MPRRRHDGAKSAIGTYDKNVTGQPAPSAPVVTETSFPTLEQGSAKKAAVVSLQHGLLGRGHSVTVDGVFGAGTKAAVIAFQKSRGLSPR